MALSQEERLGSLSINRRICSISFGVTITTDEHHCGCLFPRENNEPSHVPRTEKSVKLEGKFEGKSKRLDLGPTSDKIYYVNFAIEVSFVACGSSRGPFDQLSPSGAEQLQFVHDQVDAFIRGEHAGTCEDVEILRSE